MSRRLLGLLATGLGAALILLGLLMLGGSDAPEPTTTTTKTLIAAPTTTTTLAPTTTTTTTTTAPATTTTTTPPETLEEFVVAYRAALDSDDIAFLVDRLHPRILEIHGDELCRAWVEREVVNLDNYQIIGEVSGPADEMFTAPDGSQFAIADKFSATASFTFQGTPGESPAEFALVDGVMYWLGTCA
jgi:hypothetical protein